MDKDLEAIMNTTHSQEEIDKDIEDISSQWNIYDTPTSNDFEFEELEYWEATEPFKYPYSEVTIFDQSADPRTRTACTIFSPRIANNGQNLVERKNLWLGKYEQKDPKNDWLDYRRGWNLYTGWSIQTALKYLIKVWAISWFAVCNTESAIDTALSQGKMIATGSKFGDWWTIFKTKRYAESRKLQWHIFVIVAKDWDDYIATHWYKCCPYFRVHKSRIPKLFSKNAMLDKNDADKLEFMKARLYAQKLAPQNSEFWKMTTPSIQKKLAELNKEMKSTYNFS